VLLTGLCSISANGYDIIQLLLTLVFAADIVSNFNVATWDKKGKNWITSHHKIAQRYLFVKGFPWLGLFWVDFIATFPFDWVLGIFIDCDDIQHPAFINLLRLTRFLRLVCPFKLHRCETRPERFK
jgi:hypothetical protein